MYAVLDSDGSTLEILPSLSLHTCGRVCVAAFSTSVPPVQGNTPRINTPMTPDCVFRSLFAYYHVEVGNLDGGAQTELT
jgi:hypothetical protein